MQIFHYIINLTKIHAHTVSWLKSSETHMHAHDLPSSQNMAQSHFIKVSNAQIETYTAYRKKSLAPSVFPFWGASGTEQQLNPAKQVQLMGTLPGPDTKRSIYHYPPVTVSGGPSWKQVSCNKCVSMCVTWILISTAILILAN